MSQRAKDTGPPVRVLVVEDSPITREVLVELIEEDPAIRVIDTADSGPVAIEKIGAQRPDIVTLDLGLPGCDGFEVLRQVMARSPVPVMVLTATLRPVNRPEAFYALKLGAVHVVEKPERAELVDPRWRERFHKELKFLATVPVIQRIGWRPLRAEVHDELALESSTPASVVPRTRPAIVGIAASAGGVKAVAALLEVLPPVPVPVVVALHLGAHLHGPLARFLDETAQMPVLSIDEGEVGLQPGHVYVAPGRRHAELADWGVIRIVDDLAGAEYAPLLDHFFRSMARIYKSAAVGVILTGMGRDGAQGLLEIRQAGGMTLGQSRESCLVYGMPGAARALGAVLAEQAPAELAGTLRFWLGVGGPRESA